jgi:hypothetical protein
MGLGLQAEQWARAVRREYDDGADRCRCVTEFFDTLGASKRGYPAATLMELRADGRIPFPRREVFSAYRDEILELVPYLTNVQSIEIRSRKEVGSVVEFVNEWRGGGEIPAALRVVLSESMLSWTDYASWNSTELSCDWRIATHTFTDAVRCVGKNRFIEEGPGETLLEIRGALDVDAKKIRGIPSFLAGGIGRKVEEFLVTRIQSNLLETARSLTKYLEDKGRASNSNR